MKYLPSFVEQQAFGVCDWIGTRFGIASSKVRLYFIYVSFITLGSPIIVYLVLAFWLEHKDLFVRKRKTIWDIED